MSRPSKWDLLVWRKSSKSINGECVEIAQNGDAVAIRDSKNRRGAVLEVSRDAWRMFLASLKA